MMPYPHHLPRLYVPSTLVAAADFLLSEAQSHYLMHVLRLEANDGVRVFNPVDGEWLARVVSSNKKGVTLTVCESLRPPERISRAVHLAFSPIKKDRMDWLVEKAVELGVTDLHPILMHRSVVRDVRQERLAAQIIEAAEQSERLDIPTLHPLTGLEKFVQQFAEKFPIYAAIERCENIPLLSEITQGGDVGFLVGPEGGFDPQEADFLKAKPHIRPVSLGQRILRAETAALYGLSRLMD